MLVSILTGAVVLVDHVGPQDSEGDVGGVLDHVHHLLVLVTHHIHTVHL